MIDLSRYDLKLDVYKDFVKGLERLATCKRKQVGAIIVSEDYQEVFAVGYNGSPPGFPHCCGEDKGGAQGCGCVHAEMNACLKANMTSKGFMICTMYPCVRCAQAIIAKRKITKVFTLEEHINTDGILLLKKAGIECPGIKL